MKLLLKIILLLLTLITITLLLISFWLRTPEGSRELSFFITNFISKQTDNNYAIEIDTPKFSFPFILEAEKITLSDQESKVISLENFHINMLPSLLWLKSLTVNSISATKVLLSKIPISKENSEEDKIINLDFIPNISINNLSIDKLIIEQYEINFGINGSLQLNSGSGELVFKGKIESDKANQTEDNVSFSSNGIVDSDSLKNNSLFLDSQLNLQGKYNLKSRRINLDEIILSSPHTDINGELDINPQENYVRGNIKYKSTILEHFFTNQKSLLEGKINIFGAYGSPVLKLESQGYLNPSKDCFFKFPKSILTADLVFVDDDIRGKVTMNSGAINFTGEIGKNDHNLYLKNFVTKGKYLNGLINLVFNDQTKLIKGELNINSSNVGELKTYFPTLKKGSLDLKSSYSPKSSGAQEVSLSLSLKNLTTNNFNCGLFSAKFLLKDLWNFKIDYADVTAKTLSYGKASIRDYTLVAKDNGQFIDFKSQVKSLDPYPANLEINGKINSTGVLGLQKDLKTQLITNIKGNLGVLQITNQEPIIFTFARDFKYVSLVASNVRASGSKIDINLTANNSVLNGKLHLGSLPFMIFPDQLPEVFKNSLISLEMDLNGSLLKPKFDLNGEVSRIELIKKDPILGNLKFLINYDNNKLMINSNIRREDKLLAELKANIPYKLSFIPFYGSLMMNDMLDINFKVYKETNILALIPTPPAHKLMGYIDGQLHISGTPALLKVNGDLQVNRTEYKHKFYGIKLKEIKAKISARNNNVIISDLFATDEYSNPIKGDGKLSILSDMPFAFNFEVNKANLISTPYVQGEVSGQLSIYGNKQKAFAKGEFILGPMEFKIPEKFSDNIPTLNVIDKLDKKNRPTGEIEEVFDLSLDINLIAKHQVYVRGWGVNTLLAGDLKIKNNISDPHIFGKLQSSKGTYQEFGKVLTVKEGVLIFDGPISPSPYLNIVGVSSVNGEEIRLILSGSIFKPDITIESSEGTNSQEALSKLLFGQNPDHISAPQALALADGMRRLSGHGGGFDPMGLGRKILGVDDISIKNNEDTDTTSIGVGKYITDKVYMEVEQGDEISGAKTRIEVEITPKISLEGVTSAKGGSSVGINWRLEY